MGYTTSEITQQQIPRCEDERLGIDPVDVFRDERKGQSLKRLMDADAVLLYTTGISLSLSLFWLK